MGRSGEKTRPTNINSPSTVDEWKNLCVFCCHWSCALSGYDKTVSENYCVTVVNLGVRALRAVGRKKPQTAAFECILTPDTGPHRVGRVAEGLSRDVDSLDPPPPPNPTGAGNVITRRPDRFVFLPLPSYPPLMTQPPVTDGCTAIPNLFSNHIKGLCARPPPGRTALITRAFLLKAVPCTGAEKRFPNNNVGGGGYRTSWV